MGLGVWETWSSSHEVCKKSSRSMSAPKWILSGAMIFATLYNTYFESHWSRVSGLSLRVASFKV